MPDTVFELFRDNQVIAHLVKAEKEFALILTAIGDNPHVLPIGKDKALDLYYFLDKEL